jgi:hypothetical protein
MMRIGDYDNNVAKIYNKDGKSCGQSAKRAQSPPQQQQCVIEQAGGGLARTRRRTMTTVDAAVVVVVIAHLRITHALPWREQRRRWGKVPGRVCKTGKSKTRLFGFWRVQKTDEKYWRGAQNTDKRHY